MLSPCSLHNKDGSMFLGSFLNIYLPAPACGIFSCGTWDLVPWPGIKPCLHWECRVLATEPPRRSVKYVFSSSFSQAKNKVRVTGSFPLFTTCWGHLVWPTLFLFLVYLESSHCEMLLNLKKVWVCVCGGETGWRKEVPLFLRILKVLLQLKGKRDGILRGWRKMVSLQGISNLSQTSSDKTLGWFSPLTICLPCSQFNHNCIKSIDPCSKPFPRSLKFIQH